MSSSPPDRVSVVVPARNAAPFLASCLDAIRATAASSGPEIIVVDDRSTDATAATARGRADRVIAADGRGPAAARNAGARAARGEILVFVDADCVPRSGWLEALLAPLADPAVSGVRGAYSTDQRSLVARFTQLELDEKQARLAASARVAVVDTACCAYRREVFLRYGGFDERYPATSAEDAELSFRLSAAGERLVYAAGARVRHHHPERLGHYLWRKLRFGYFRARLYARYPCQARDDGYTPRLMPAQIALASLLALSAAGSPWRGLARRACALAGLAFALTSLPLVRRAWATDRPLARYVPLLLLARSLAQAAGLASGLASLGLDAARRRVSGRAARAPGPTPGGSGSQ